MDEIVIDLATWTRLNEVMEYARVKHGGDLVTTHTPNSR